MSFAEASSTVLRTFGKFQGGARGDDLGEQWSRAGCLHEVARVCLGDWLDRAEASTNISGTVQPRAGASQQEESP